MKIEAENRFIAALLSGPDDALPIVPEQLDQADFSDVEYGQIFAAARGLWIHRRPVNEVAISEETAIPVQRLTEITTTSSDWEPPSRAGYYAQIIMQHSMKRHLQDGIKALASKNGDMSAPDLLAAMDALSTLQHKRLTGGEKADSASCVAEIRKAIKDHKQSPPLGTGIRALDLITTSGFQPGHLWLLGGYTSTGKTTLAVQLAAEVLRRGGGVVFFSLEMNREEITRRLVAYLANMGSTKILKNLVDPDDLEDAFLKVERLPIWTYQKVFSLPTMVSLVKKHQHERKISLIVIDYVQHLKGKGSLFDRMSHVALELKEQSKALGVAILALSQVNNESQRNPVQGLHEYKGAGDLAASAEVALMLVPKGDRDLSLEIRKNKHGRRGRLTLQFRENYSGIEEVKRAKG